MKSSPSSVPQSEQNITLKTYSILDVDAGIENENLIRTSGKRKADEECNLELECTTNILVVLGDVVNKGPFSAEVI